MQIRLAIPEIQTDSIVDGKGIRAVIWTQGCRHHCKGCHNPMTHSFTDGYLVDVEDIKKDIARMQGQDGITLSGGDPLEQVDACLEIAKYCQSIKLNVWCYTGYTYEELLDKAKKEPNIIELLENVDVLVDGRFVLEEKSFDVPFRGSKNQRLIDPKRSLKLGKVVLANFDELDGLLNSSSKMKVFV